jgi:hypothetical protein
MCQPTCVNLIRKTPKRRPRACACMRACPTARPFSRLAVVSARPPSQGDPTLPPLHTHFPPPLCPLSPAATPAFPCARARRSCRVALPPLHTRFPPPLYPFSPAAVPAFPRHTRVPMRPRPPFLSCRHARRVHLHGPSLAWPSRLPALPRREIAPSRRPSHTRFLPAATPAFPYARARRARFPPPPAPAVPAASTCPLRPPATSRRRLSCSCAPPPLHPRPARHSLVSVALSTPHPPPHPPHPSP